MRFCLKIEQKGLEFSSVVQHLPGMKAGLSLIPSIAKIKKQKHSLWRTDDYAPQMDWKFKDHLGACPGLGGTGSRLLMVYAASFGLVWKDA